MIKGPIIIRHVFLSSYLSLAIVFLSQHLPTYTIVQYLNVKSYFFFMYKSDGIINICKIVSLKLRYDI